MNKRDEKTQRRNEEYLDAMRYIANMSPELFAMVSKDFLENLVLRHAGTPSAGLVLQMTSWLEEDWQWSHISEVIPEGYLDERAYYMRAPNLDELDPARRAVMEALIAKFDGTEETPWTHYRWDAATRDQFIVLGMIAMNGMEGVRQGRIVHYLGLGNPVDEYDLRGSNAVRAAKVALTRYLGSRVNDPHTSSIFDEAEGNGGRRLHRMSDPVLAQFIARYCLSHNAGAMLPEPPFGDTYLALVRGEEE